MQLRNILRIVSASIFTLSISALFAQEGNFMIRHATNLDTTDTVVKIG